MGLSQQKYQNYFNESMDFETYLGNFEKEMNAGEESKFAAYLPQNWQRQSRILRKLQVSSKLSDMVKSLDKKEHWLVITEHWCGDASQIVPVLHKIAEENKDKIDFRVTYRDENLELIDAHLTDGKSRSIPIMIRLDESFNVIDSYGPRPAEAQELVKSLKANGEEYGIPLHTWYAKNKQQSIQEEVTILLSK